MEGLCNPFTGCSRSSRETDCRAQPLTGSVYVLDSSAYLNCPWQICPVHGQDFLPVYYLVLRPAVSARVALWREIVGGRKLFSSSQREGSLLIFLSFFFALSLEFRYKLIRLWINVTSFFFLELIYRTCICLIIYFAKILSPFQERYCNCNIQCFDNGVVSTLCLLIFIIKVNVIRTLFCPGFKIFRYSWPKYSLVKLFEAGIWNSLGECDTRILPSGSRFSKVFFKNA